MNQKFEKYLKLTSISSAILVFLGFLNKEFYYSEFGIKIINYTTVSEIILSFLPIILLIIIYILFQILVVLYSNLLTRFHSFERKTINRLTMGKSDKSTNFVKRIHHRRNKSRPFAFYLSFLDYQKFPRLSAKIKLYLLFQILIHPVFIGLLILIMLSIFANEKYYEDPNQSHNYINFIIMILILWIPMILNLGYILLVKLFKLNIDYPSFLVLFSIFWIGIILKSGNNMRALKIKDGFGDTSISFIYDKTKIESSKTLIYVGDTKEYIFLYDQNSKDSKVFKKDNTRHLSIKSINKNSNIPTSWN